MTNNTKERHEEIQAAAAAALENVGGVEYIDSLDQSERLPVLRRMYDTVQKATDCEYSTAKRNVAKALRRARYGVMQKRWGGVRPNSGRPPKEA